MMRRAHPLRVCGLLVALAWSSAAPPATALPDDKAAAEVLFQEGVRLMQANDLGAACRKLDASQKLDPAVGTLLRLGHCYEQLGRTASAWATFKEAASLAALEGQVERREMAEARAAALQPRLSTLALLIAEHDAPPGVKVLRNGVSVPRASWGVALPVDPGEQVVEVSAPGYRSFRSVLRTDQPGTARTLPIPPLERLPRPSASKPRGSQPATLLRTSSANDVQADHSGPQRSWAFVVGGVGAAGIVAGSVLGIVAYSRNRDSLDECLPEDGSACTQEGKELRDGASNYAFGSTVAFVAGGVLLAGGIVLYATAPSPKRETARLELGMQNGSLGLRGAF
jgi:hypothetical protein